MPQPFPCANTRPEGYPSLFWGGQFTYGNYLDEVWTLDDRSGGITVADLNDGTGNDRHFYHCNTLYHIYGITDEAANLVEAYQYDAYGKQTVITDGNDGDTIVNFSGNDVRTVGGNSSVGNPYMYTGQRFDPETGLGYWKLRHYSYDLGRFLNRNPWGNAHWFYNLYDFSDGMVTMFVEPLSGKEGAQPEAPPTPRPPAPPVSSPKFNAPKTFAPPSGKPASGSKGGGARGALGVFQEKGERMVKEGDPSSPEYVDKYWTQELLGEHEYWIRAVRPQSRMPVGSGETVTIIPPTQAEKDERIRGLIQRIMESGAATEWRTTMLESSCGKDPCIYYYAWCKWANGMPADDPGRQYWGGGERMPCEDCHKICKDTGKWPFEKCKFPKPPKRGTTKPGGFPRWEEGGQNVPPTPGEY